MAKQMLIDATRGKTTEKAPWVPYVGVSCANLIEEPADNYLKNPELIAKGVVTAAKEYCADGIPLMFDLSMEAESIGCEVEYWEDNVPSVKTHLCEKETPAELGMGSLSKSAGRWPIVFEAAAIAKPLLDELDCCMLGLVTGPLTLASHLAGVRIFTALKKDKAFAHAILSYAGELCAASTRFYLEMGCDLIAIVDPVASQIRPATFDEFVTPNCQEAITAIHETGKTSSFFICGDCTKVIENVCQVGTHGFAIDEQMNLSFVRDIARKYGKGFGGNLKLTLALSLGLLSPREDALISLAIGGTQGYTFAPG